MDILGPYAFLIIIIEWEYREYNKGYGGLVLYMVWKEWDTPADKLRKILTGSHHFEDRVRDGRMTTDCPQDKTLGGWKEEQIS